MKRNLISTAALVLLSSALVQVQAQAGNGATLVTQSVPNSMQAGKTYSVSVTFKNTGTTTWTAADNYSLGSQNPSDNWRWGFGRVSLAAGESVLPGSYKTFTFNITAPAASSACLAKNANQPQMITCDFQWGLVQDGVEWLNTGTNVEVLWINAPTVTLHYPPVAAPVAVTASKFSNANFRGANVLMQTYEDEMLCDHTSWLPDASKAQTIIDKAKSMGLNVLRVPVIIPPKVAGKPADWGIGQNVCLNPQKPEWGSVTDGVVLMQGVNDKMQVIFDKANAAGIKIIPIIDGYTKYNETCYWKQSYVNVKDNALTFINKFKNHPALLAWDVMNEPLWNAHAFNCLNSTADYNSVVDAVHAMYNLVRSNDAAHPTTVGEHQVPFLKYWKDISSFASPHLYIGANSGNPASLDQINFVQRATIAEMVNAVGTMPVVIGEFGTADSDATFNASYYQRYLDGLTIADRGFMLWSMSMGAPGQGISIIDTYGNAKPAGQVVDRQQWQGVVQQLYLGYTGRPADPAALANFGSSLSALAADMKTRSLQLGRSVGALDAAYSTEPALRTLIDSLYNSSEFQSLYPVNDVQAFVKKAYQTIFNRQPDAAGLQFWSDQINYYGLQKQRAVASILAAGLTNTSAQGLLDAATETKKAAVAANFTANLNTPARVACYSGPSKAADARTFLAQVTSSTNVTAYQADIFNKIFTMCGL
jgi:hypothetical protein